MKDKLIKKLMGGKGEFTEEEMHLFYDMSRSLEYTAFDTWYYNFYRQQPFALDRDTDVFAAWLSQQQKIKQLESQIDMDLIETINDLQEVNTNLLELLKLAYEEKVQLRLSGDAGFWDESDDELELKLKEALK